MEIKRRKFLQGVLASGGLLASGDLFSAVVEHSSSSSVISKQLWLRTGTLLDSEFARGLADTLLEDQNSLRLSSTELYCPTTIKDIIAAHNGKQLLGIINDSHFLLLHELVRSTGGRVLYTGQHSWHQGPDNRSCHEIMTTPRTGASGLALSNELTARGEQVMLNQFHQGTGGMSHLSEGLQLPNQGGWPELVAMTLSQTGTSKVIPGRINKNIFSRKMTGIPQAGSLVSFLFEV